MKMEIGIDSFAATIPNPATGQTVPAADRMQALLAEVETDSAAPIEDRLKRTA
jgi:hypothetical protein